MNLDNALQTFIVEARELLDDMENALLGVEQAQDKTELLNAIFRAAHTIKGSAGLFGLDHVVEFTHVVESLLDAARDGKVTLAGPLVALLLDSRDQIGALVEQVASGNTDADAATAEHCNKLAADLRKYTAAPEEKSAAAVPPPATAAPAAPADAESAAAVTSDQWHISLRFGRDVLRNGMDPLSFIRYLGKLGEVSGIATLPDALPEIDAMDPESCYLGFEIAFRSSADKAAIENVFEFVRDDCRVSILPPKSRITEYVRLIEDLPEESARLGELLVRCGSLTAQELDAALDSQTGGACAQPLGAILVEQGAVRAQVVDAALTKQKQVEKLKAQDQRLVRVDADKLDRLINLIGELVIAGASTNLIAQQTRVPELLECASTLSGLVEEVRDSALQLRMVKIAATFNRFQRVVHDVSREIGKDIELAVSGEDTELDKTVVEQIADPLTHLVRNAMDHGIEPPALRAERGKPARGTVKLNAYHDSGSIVIEVIDDGGGLAREKILAKAVERGLIEAGRSLSDKELYALVFEPGFSTAEKVTNLSGRGVGMDVVKRNISALRGSVEMASEEGVGTTVTVRLPLTLAIIDGFLIGLGKASFVVPLEMIEECIEYTCQPGHNYTNLRGAVLPFIRLRELFEVDGEIPRRQNIVVVRHAGRKAGLVVDALLGEFQTVIKPLGKMFNRVAGISGSTILGSGEVALILDVPALVRQASEAEATCAADA
jgi:two-component system chemotaxis sensor kinase CheA